MDISQIVGLIVVVIAIFAFILRRFKDENRQKRKRLERQENEKRKRSIAVISSRSRTDKLIDYSSYQLSFTEYIITILVSMIAIFVIGQLFYDNLFITIPLLTLAFFAPKFRRKQLIEKRKEQLTLQFKEAAASLSSSLAAGQSIENALGETLRDLLLLYPDKDTYIIKELGIINRRVENGESVERAFSDFAQRTNIDDIMNFSDVFVTCKRSGGDLVDVIKRTVDVINEKIEIQQDIKVLVSQKKFESRIIGVMPLAMIAFLKFTSGDFVAPLYEFGTPGPLVMTFALVCTIVSMVISQKLMKIEM